ncbi:tryptophan dimethylallyltransferase-domain-containing protein [Mycena maculata]|uniref:Tryptophan dimethylallyltransferase-domain-containing protein n=1 Tax=Mycena maculata TaxID=230809 RepID=A0AAD7IQR9_9AGAR|nr:tryptophan dimethylallyltransferase-domain-containing protein [Mycena maculata]
MSFWWNTVALPIPGFMRHANYPEDAVQSYASLFRDKLLPLLGPCTNPTYPSWMTEDYTTHLWNSVSSLGKRPNLRSDLPWTLWRSHWRESTRSRSCGAEWFDICAQELALATTHERPKENGYPVSEIYLGFDCSHHSSTMKAYFMPRIRSLVSKESPEEMVKKVTDRLGLERPWAKVGNFLSLFPSGDRPAIKIVAIDCVPGSRNRLKIYFRINILSYSHMEYFLTLGGVLSTADLSASFQNARLVWDAMTKESGLSNDLPTQSSYLPSGLIYYELKQGDDSPSSKVRYLPNDLAISHGIERLACQLSGSSTTNDYPDVIRTIFPHRALSSRTGIHTYVGCTVNPTGGDVSVYYNPEAFAPERILDSCMKDMQTIFCSTDARSTEKQPNWRNSNRGWGR